MLTALLFTAIDTVKFHKGYQIHCMETIVGIDDSTDVNAFLSNIKLLTPDFYDQGVCAWAGVQCNEDGFVTDINWNNSNFFPIKEFRWLPSTLRSMDIADKNALCSFHTRYLPGRMEFCRIEQSKSFGTLDFIALPPRLREIRLPSNNFYGKVTLTQLPATMEVIDLSRNQLDGAIVVNSLLPAGLKRVTLFQPDKPMRIKCVDAKKVDARVIKKHA